MAWSVEYPTLGFSSGHDPKVVGLSPSSVSPYSGGTPLEDSLPLLLPQRVHSAHSRLLSLKRRNNFFKASPLKCFNFIFKKILFIF